MNFIKNVKLIFLILFVVIISQYKSFSQCNVEMYLTKSMRNLEKGFQFSKSYRIDGRSGARKRIEYTCVFSKDTNYQIQIDSRDGKSAGIIATLYDSRRNRIISTYYNNKFLPGFTYKCRSTGIYYISFTFKDSKFFCGAAVLGFRR